MQNAKNKNIAYFLKKRVEAVLQRMECNLEFTEFTLKNEKYIFLYPIREN